MINADAKTWIAIAAFVAQSAGTVYLFGQQNQETVSKLSSVQEQLKEIKTNQVLLSQAVTDIAVMKVRQETQAQALADLRNSQYGKR